MDQKTDSENVTEQKIFTDFFERYIMILIQEKWIKKSSTVFQYTTARGKFLNSFEKK